MFQAARKDHENACQLQANVAGRKERDQSENQARHEPENRYALENIKNGHEQLLSQLVLGGPVPVDDGEPERHAVGGESSDKGEECVAWQGAQGQVNHNSRSENAGPLLAHLSQAIEKAEDAKRNSDVCENSAVVQRHDGAGLTPDWQCRGALPTWGTASRTGPDEFLFFLSHRLSPSDCHLRLIVPQKGPGCNSGAARRVVHS